MPVQTELDRRFSIQREQQRFVAIGHMTKDTEPKDHLGGGVSYAAVAARRSGVEDVHIITKFPPGHPYINQLEREGIQVHLLDSTHPERKTTFKNVYHGEHGEHRTQIVSDVQDQISAADLAKLEKQNPGLLHGAAVLLAPVMNEFEDVGKIVDHLTEMNATTALTPQGFFREAGEEEDDGRRVNQIKWTSFESYLPMIDTVVYSKDDLDIGGKFDGDLHKKIIDNSPRVAMTQAHEGVTIFEGGKPSLNVPAFQIERHEINKDYTGAGDVFATIFFLEMQHNGGNVEAAALAATLFTSIKIIQPDSRTGGLDNIPDEQRIKNFKAENPERIERHVGRHADIISFL